MKFVEQLRLWKLETFSGGDLLQAQVRFISWNQIRYWYSLLDGARLVHLFIRRWICTCHASFQSEISSNGRAPLWRRAPDLVWRPPPRRLPGWHGPPPGHRLARGAAAAGGQPRPPRTSGRGRLPTPGRPRCCQTGRLVPAPALTPATQATDRPGWQSSQKESSGTIITADLSILCSNPNIRLRLHGVHGVSRDPGDDTETRQRAWAPSFPPFGRKPPRLSGTTPAGVLLPVPQRLQPGGVWYGEGGCSARCGWEKTSRSASSPGSLECHQTFLLQLPICTMCLALRPTADNDECTRMHPCISTVLVIGQLMHRQDNLESI